MVRDETVVEAGGWLFTEGRGRQFVEAIRQGKELFVEGGGKPLGKGGGKLFVEAGEPIGQGKDDAVVKGGRKPFVKRGWMATVRREREDASAREGGCQRERGRMPAREREDASAREGGCQHKRGRLPV